MKCPKCRLDLRQSGIKEEDGKVIKQMYCGNPRCSEYRQVIRVETADTPSGVGK